MKENRDRVIDFIIKQECRPGEDQTGSYHNDPDDPGGDTKFGISQRAHPEIRVRDIDRTDAEAIYRKEYWDVCGCDSMPPGIDLIVCDFAVTSGPGRSARTFVNAARNMRETPVGLGVSYYLHLIDEFTRLRKIFYSDLADMRKQPRQKRDWLIRAERVQQEARNMLMKHADRILDEEKAIEERQDGSE